MQDGGLQVAGSQSWAAARGKDAGRAGRRRWAQGYRAQVGSRGAALLRVAACFSPASPVSILTRLPPRSPTCAAGASQQQGCQQQGALHSGRVLQARGRRAAGSGVEWTDWATASRHLRPRCTRRQSSEAARGAPCSS